MIQWNHVWPNLLKGRKKNPKKLLEVWRISENCSSKRLRSELNPMDLKEWPPMCITISMKNQIAPLPICARPLQGTLEYGCWEFKGDPTRIQVCTPWGGIMRPAAPLAQQSGFPSEPEKDRSFDKASFQQNSERLQRFPERQTSNGNTCMICFGWMKLRRQLNWALQ